MSRAHYLFLAFGQFWSIMIFDIWLNISTASTVSTFPAMLPIFAHFVALEQSDFATFPQLLLQKPHFLELAAQIWYDSSHCAAGYRVLRANILVLPETTLYFWSVFDPFVIQNFRTSVEINIATVKEQTLKYKVFIKS